VEGDRLILFSDGLFEAFSADGEPWGIARLEDACRKTRHVSLEAALTAIVQEVQDWQQGTSFRDDLAIMAFQVGKQEYEP
jgi:serine phosphatase RsbU (regulator of sigma subunit)